MALMSLAEFGGLYGRTKQAAAKWKAKGYLVVSGGKIDSEPSISRLAEYGINQPASVDGARQPIVNTPATSVEPIDLDEVVADADEFIKRVLRGDYATQAEAERIKENALALKHVLDGRQKAGALVEVEAAERILFESARMERDSWLNWPARVGPTIAASLGSEADKVVEILNEHVQSHLADIGEPEADFRTDD